MKYILLLFILNLVIATNPVQAQQAYPEVMKPRPPLLGTVYERIPKGFAFPERLRGFRLENRIITNPGMRYVIQNLKKEQFGEPEVNDAVKTLLQYTDDEQLNYLIKYLRQYSKDMGKREKALQTLQSKINYDSIEFYAGNQQLLSEDYEEYLNTDLQTLVSYIRQDSNYVWVRNASRDSVLLELLSMADNSARFWINTGRSEFHRFWAANKMGDTIGTWIQVLPQGSRLRIYVDEDVYQAPRIETTKKECYIPTPSLNSYMTLNKLYPGELHRRYWTYYSEVEIAMSQGALVNWSSGGENSLSLLSNVRYFWNYNRNKTSWENWVHYRSGFMKNGEEDLRKNEDRFELNSKVGQKAFKHWYYTAQFNILTQLFNSYDYPKDKERKLVANFMSPGYFTLSLGLDFKPNNDFSLVVSPIAGKWNFVRDTSKIDEKRYGIELGKRYRREAGARLDFNNKVSNLFNILEIRNQLVFFMSYEEKDRYKNFGKKDEEKKKFWGTVNWKLTLNFKINYFMRASINTETVYDENYKRKVQFKENLNLGVNFRF